MKAAYKTQPQIKSTKNCDKLLTIKLMIALLVFGYLKWLAKVIFKKCKIF